MSFNGTKIRVFALILVFAKLAIPTLVFAYSVSRNNAQEDGLPSLTVDDFACIKRSTANKREVYINKYDAMNIGITALSEVFGVELSESTIQMKYSPGRPEEHFFIDNVWLIYVEQPRAWNGYVWPVGLTACEANFSTMQYHFNVNAETGKLLGVQHFPSWFVPTSNATQLSENKVVCEDLNYELSYYAMFLASSRLNIDVARAKIFTKVEWHGLFAISVVVQSMEDKFVELAFVISTEMEKELVAVCWNTSSEESGFESHLYFDWIKSSKLGDTYAGLRTS
jgi:hypothetical protein